MPIDTQTPAPVAVTVRRPTHRVLLHVAAAALVGSLLTDVAYWRSAEMMWANFSAWLVSAGTLVGLLAVLAGLFDWMTGRLRGIGPAGRRGLLGYLLAWVLAVVNAFVHTRDGWTSVVPWGLALSAITVILIVVCGVLGWRGDARLPEPGGGVNWRSAAK